MKYIILAIVPLLFFLMPCESHAYVDLGLAGALFQAAYLIFFAILAFVAAPFLFFWKKIKARLFSKKKDGQNKKKDNKDKTIIHD